MKNKIPYDAIRTLIDRQQQLDFAGIMVGVSRQALDEVLDYIRADSQPADVAGALGELKQARYTGPDEIYNGAILSSDGLFIVLSKETVDMCISSLTAQQQPVNGELLGALKEVKYKSESHLNNGLGDFAGYISDIRMIVTEAIARAEQSSANETKKGGV